MLTVTSNPPFPGATDTFPERYRLTDLGEAEGLPLIPVALNDRGQMALYTQPSEAQARSTVFRGFLHDGRQLHERVTAVGGVPVMGLSASGLLCGQQRWDGGPLRAWALHLRNLGITHWPDTESCAVAVNDRGDVAGYVVFAAEGRVRRRVFLVNARNEAAFLPATNGSGTCATALNEDGTVLYNTHCGPFEINSAAVVWRDGVGRTIPGLPGTTGLWGAVLTPAGRVAGRLLTNGGGLSAFWHEDGRTYDLNPGPIRQSEALAANDRRVVVGRMIGADGKREAFRWTPADGMRALAALTAGADGWELQRAVAVNAAGLIAGRGLRQGEPRGFLLTPVA